MKMRRMFLDKFDVFDTPTLRYYKVKREFQERYLNPQVWNKGYGSREDIKAYHEVLVYIEKTEELRDEDLDLKTEIPTDIEHLVFRYLPLPVKIRQEMFEFVNPRNLDQDERLERIKEFFEKMVKSGLSALQFNEWPDPRCVKIKENAMKVKSDDEEEFVERKVYVRKNLKDEERISEGNEILNIRQRVYAKLKQGRDARSLLKMLKWKIEKFLRNYGGDISYYEGTEWMKKIVITEKAVAKSISEYHGKKMKILQLMKK